MKSLKRELRSVLVGNGRIGLVDGRENTRGMKVEETEGRESREGEKEQRTIVYGVNGH